MKLPLSIELLVCLPIPDSYFHAPAIPDINNFLMRIRALPTFSPLHHLSIASGFHHECWGQVPWPQGNAAHMLTLGSAHQRTIVEVGWTVLPHYM